MYSQRDLRVIAGELLNLKEACLARTTWGEPVAALRSLPDYCEFSTQWPSDPAGQWETNIALRNAVHAAWAVAHTGQMFDRLLQLSKWIVRDWGGIKSAKDETILLHMSDAAVKKSSIPFTGISSKSKVLAIADPLERQIYDARVAAALNVLQDKLELSSRTYFRVPPTQITWISKREGGHEKIYDRSYYIEKRGFRQINDQNIYSVYSFIVPKLAVECDMHPIEVEMTLFSAAETLVPAASPSLT